MTPALYLEKMKDAYYDEGGARVDDAKAFLNQAKEEAVGDKPFGWWWTKRFNRLVKHHGLTDLARILEDHEDNKGWNEDQKALYRPIVDEAIDSTVRQQEEELLRVAPATIPKSPWKRKSFLQTCRLRWREEAMRAIETQAKDELAGRVVEMANLQVRLTLFLTLSTALVAVVSLWSNKLNNAAWITAVATIVGCAVFRIALIPMRSKFKQVWFHKYVDPIVWASLAADPLGRVCLLRNATAGRNRVITRYKKTLWALVPCMSVVLVGLASISVVNLNLL